MNNRNVLVGSVVVVLGVALWFFFFRTPRIEPVVPVADSVTHYACRNGTIDAIYGDSSVMLATSDGRIVTLPQVVSGSGIRYEKDRLVFVSKGDNAFLEDEGKKVIDDCVINNTLGIPSSDSEEQVFIDQGKTITFLYPKKVLLSSAGIGYTPSWRVNTQTLGIVLAKLTIPKTTQPKTNFSEAVFTVGTSSDAVAIKQCLVATNGEVAKGKTTINGISYAVTELGDAGAGNFYTTKSYRTLRNDQCYVIEYTVHSTNIGAYSPDQGISEFNAASVVKDLEGIVQSFKFL